MPLVVLAVVVAAAYLGFRAYHPKPVGMLNVAGFYDPLLAFLDTTVTGGFVKPEHRGMLLVDTEPPVPRGAPPQPRAAPAYEGVGRVATP